MKLEWSGKYEYMRGVIKQDASFFASSGSAETTEMATAISNLADSI
jgi:hypothetical protein